MDIYEDSNIKLTEINNNSMKQYCQKKIMGIINNVKLLVKWFVYSSAIG